MTGMRRVTVRMPEALLKRIEHVTEVEGYQDRSELLRDGARRLVEASLDRTAVTVECQDCEFDTEVTGTTDVQQLCREAQTLSAEHEREYPGHRARVERPRTAEVSHGD